MKRDISIDFVKGIGMFLVIYGHIHTGDNFTNNWVYSFHMPLFFIISGMFIKERKKDENLLVFIKKEAKKLLYPYVIFSLIRLLLSCYPSFNSYEVKRMVVDTLFLSGRGVFWFLSTLFLSEIFYYIVRRSKHENLIMVVIMLSTIFTSNYLQMHGANTYLTLNYCLNIPNRMLIGAVFLWVGRIAIKNGFLTTEKVVKNNKLIIFCVLIFVLNFIFADKNGHIDLHYSQINNGFLYYWFAISSTLCLIIFSKRFVNKNNIISYIGKNSLIVMVTHTTFHFTSISQKIINYFINNVPSFLLDGFAVLLVIFIELFVIELVNHFFPYFIKMDVRKFKYKKG